MSTDVLDRLKRIETKLVRGFEELDVGDTARVRLLAVDAEKSFIDFERA